MGVNCYKGNTTFCSPCYPARTCMPSSQYGGSCGFGGAMVGRCGPAANCWRGSPTTYATYEQAKQYGAFGNFDQCKSYAASRPCGSDIVWQPRRPYQKCEINEPCAPAPCSTPCTPCGGLGNVCNPSTCGPYAPCGPFGFHTSCAGRPSRPCNPCSGPCIQNVACLARRDGTACGSCCGPCGPCASAASCGPRAPSCDTCAQCGPAGPCKPCASCKPCSSRTSCCPCAGLSTSCNLCAPQYTGNRCAPCRSAACCGPCGQNSACGPCGPCRAPCGQFGRCGRSSSCGPCDSNAHCNPAGVYGPPVPCPPSDLAAPFNPYSPSATYMPGAQCGRVCAPSTCSIPRRTFRYPNYTAEYLAAIRQYCGEPQKKLRVKRVIRKRKETSTEESLTTSKAVAKVKG